MTGLQVTSMKTIEAGNSVGKNTIESNSVGSLWERFDLECIFQRMNV